MAALDAEAASRIEPVTTGLFEMGDARAVFFGVAVRGVRRPVAGRGEDLGHDERVAGILALDRDAVDCATAGLDGEAGCSVAMRDQDSARKNSRSVIGGIPDAIGVIGSNDWILIATDPDAPLHRDPVDRQGMR